VVALNNSSPAVNGGYEDYTCQLRTRLVQGKRYVITTTTGTAAPQAIKAWIDGNGNGTFEDSELILSKTAAVSPADTFTCPTPTGAAIGRPVRLRIITDGQGTTIAGCRNPQLGQSEDYTILLVENVQAPIAIFARVGGTNCDSTYTFESSSENAITAYFWDFGDSSGIDSTSGITATHTYAQPGRYAVSLRVVGPFGTDTARVANAVNYVAAPAQALCGAPQTNNTCCNIGIRNVQFGTINVSSGDAGEGYRDFTCEGSSDIIVAQPVPFRITTGTSQAEGVFVWVDINNDNVFSTSEQLLTLPFGTGVRTGSITLPANTVRNVPLRMRVLGNASRTPTQNPCNNLQFAQFEDYSITALDNVLPPTALWSAASRISCQGTIAFIDSSVNATAYFWEFGDGNVSTQASPTHTYSSPGTYTVRLITENSYGTDTLERANYITIVPIVQIAAAPCLPTASQPFTGVGLLRVQFGTINNATADGRDGYKDYTCTQIASLPYDTVAILRITTGTVTVETVAAWIDYDANGQFETSERIANGTTQGASGVFSVAVRPPTGAAVNRALRLRVMSDSPAAPPGTALIPCQNVRVGQVEDYTVYLTADISQPPIAGFSSTNSVTCSGLVTFKDSSLQFPTSRLWRFGDGATDSTVNPSHQYSAPGTYTVTLITRNAVGVDSLVRSDYVVYTPVVGLPLASCVPTFQQTTGNTGIRSLTVGGTSIITTQMPLTPGVYQDKTCSFDVLASIGDSVQVQLTSNAGTDAVFVYLDINGNGTFAGTEMVRRLTRSGTSLNYFGGFLTPAVLPVGVPIRLRILMLNTSGGQIVISPCTTNRAGQAVDITLRAQRVAPTANFTALQTSCTSTVSFTSTSSGGPTSYEWLFGDGTTSTFANPQRTYATPGDYAVRLVVSNPVGTDTIERQVTVTPVATLAVCQPTRVQVSLQPSEAGMTFVAVLNNVTGQGTTWSTSGSTAGYQDLVCVARPLTIDEGLVVRVQAVNQGSPNGITHLYTVQLDANNDGTFDASELMGSITAIGRNSGIIRFTVPTTTPGGLLRLRITGYLNSATAPTCTQITDGQVEDYGLFVLKTVGTVAAQVSLGLELAPNPSHDQVRVVATLPLGKGAQITLIDALGKVVHQQAYQASTDSEYVNTAALPAGVYQVVLQQGTTRLLRRLVVEK
jgi:PKD repeat protein